MHNRNYTALHTPATGFNADKIYIFRYIRTEPRSSIRSSKAQDLRAGIDTRLSKFLSVEWRQKCRHDTFSFLTTDHGLDDRTIYEMQPVAWKEHCESDIIGEMLKTVLNFTQ